MTANRLFCVAASSRTAFRANGNVWIVQTTIFLSPVSAAASLQDLFGDDPSLHLPTLYYAAPELVRSFPEILKLLLEEINEAGAQVNRDHLAAVQRLRDQLKVSDEWLERLKGISDERSVVPLDSRSLEGLQQQADVLRELRLIPRRVKIADGTYSLIMRQNWTYCASSRWGTAAIASGAAPLKTSSCSARCRQR